MCMHVPHNNATGLGSHFPSHFCRPSRLETQVHGPVSIPKQQIEQGTRLAAGEAGTTVPDGTLSPTVLFFYPAWFC